MNTREKKIILNNSYLSSFGYFRISGSTSHTYVNRLSKYFLCLLFGIIFFTDVSANPKELVTKYSIHMLGANVGEFSVIQTNTNGIVYIEAITYIEVHLLFVYRIKYVQQTIYKQGILQNSHVKTYKNEKLSSEMWMKFEKGSYLLVVDGDTTIINDTITYSGSLLYFNEPKSITRIYNERSAEMRCISPVSEHLYTIIDEKGMELNRYYYKDGILESATLRNALGNLELKRKSVKGTND